MTKEEREIYNKHYYEKTKSNRKTKEFKEITRIQNKKYYKNNKKKIISYVNEYNKKRRKTDILFKLSNNLRVMASNALTRKGFKKKTKTAKILGCSFGELKIYIETKWEHWMNWDNYGKYNGTPNFGWDIDHIIELKKAKNEEDLLRLNHYTNLQPLCSYINRKLKNINNNN